MKPLSGLHAVLANKLFELGAIQLGEFKLKQHQQQPNAPLSPIKINLRPPELGGPMDAQALYLCGTLMHERLYQSPADQFPLISFECMAGIPRAGRALAESLRHEIGWWPVSLIELGKEETEAGRMITGVSGDFDPGDRVLLVDDVITFAHTKLEAIAAVKEVDLRIAGLVVLVDRQQGGSKQLQNLG
jgi:uridine monophosphate synthetase